MAEAATADRRREGVGRPGRGSMERRAKVGFRVAVSLLAVAAALAGIGLVGAARDRTRLLDRVDPAIQHADDYETALIDQSSNARIHAEIGSVSAAVAYAQGVSDERTASRQLARDIQSLPALAGTVARIAAATRAWQVGYLQPMMAGAGPDPGALNAARVSGASLAFGRIRGDLAVLQAMLGRLRTGAVQGFNDALNLLTGLVIAVFVGFAGILVVLRLVVRRRILAPLLAVAADSRRVTGGDFDHPVAPAGPPEIAGLARDIDAMRSRVVHDLYDLEAAHAELAARRLELEEQGRELARSNRDLEQFAYVASHDLQEPLRKVAAFCQLLADRYADELDDKGRQYIDFAVDGAKRMQALVTDLLSFSRVGRSDEGWTDVDLGDALRVARSNLEARIERTGATVEVPATLPVVRGDAALLVALFQNLIGNSVKFRGEAPPVVVVSCRRAGDEWEISVSDNGIGIEAQFAERVFVIFQRLHPRDRYEGTGIGLALCRKIVEFHGGRISVEARPAPGTTITLTLPALPAIAHPEALLG